MPPEIPIEPAEIFELRQYADAVGRRVIMKSRLNGDPIEYLGQSNGRINFPTGPPYQWSYSFKIDATDVEDAFAKFEDAIKEQWPAVLEERKSFLTQQAAQAQSRIVVAGAGPQLPGGQA